MDGRKTGVHVYTSGDKTEQNGKDLKKEGKRKKNN